MLPSCSPMSNINIFKCLSTLLWKISSVMRCLSSPCMLWLFQIPHRIYMGFKSGPQPGYSILYHFYAFLIDAMPHSDLASVFRQKTTSDKTYDTDNYRTNTNNYHKKVNIVPAWFLGLKSQFHLRPSLYKYLHLSRHIKCVVFTLKHLRKNTNFLSIKCILCQIIYCVVSRLKGTI